MRSFVRAKSKTFVVTLARVRPSISAKLHVTYAFARGMFQGACENQRWLIARTRFELRYSTRRKTKANIMRATLAILVREFDLLRLSDDARRFRLAGRTTHTHIRSHPFARVIPGHSTGANKTQLPTGPSFPI
jgi:hypothetical protein